jgi:hypothetical protein
LTDPYTYSTIYSQQDEYRLRQASSESNTEYIVMERDVNDLLECERDEAQKMMRELL